MFTPAPAAQAPMQAWFRRPVIALALAVSAVAATFLFLAVTKPANVRPGTSDIPIPFLPGENHEGGGGSNLAGSVTYIRTLASGVEFYEMDFIGDTSQQAPADKVYLIRVPSNVTSIPFERVIQDSNPGTTKPYYGYLYTSANAAQEIANQTATGFAQRFPGIFFASAAALATHGGDLNAFATQNGIVFKPAGAFQANSNNVLLDGPQLIAFVPVDVALTIEIAPLCGNTWKADTEECDDGDIAPGDGCSATCTVENGFTCDTDSPSVCTPSPVCGDAITTQGETCDDGNTASGDGCSSACATEAGYLCTAGSPSLCSKTCGDGTRGQGEDCDDGNDTSGDGCSATCTVENGFTCNTATPNVCEPGATAVCGNSMREGDACGDAFVDNNEECDWAIDCEFVANGNSCTCHADCTLCDGNENCAFIEPAYNGETCDDGNTVSGDGCSDTCDVEDDYTCNTAMPNICTEVQVCGDGNLGGTEACDDGNAVAGDGCSATCAIENGYVCTGEPSVCFEQPGSLFVQRTPVPASTTHLMLGGELAQPALHLSLWTNGQEDIAIDGMDIQSIAPESRSIERIEIYSPQNVLLGTATTAGCGATTALNDLFCVTFDTGALIVSKTQTGYVLLRPRIRPDTSSGVSGDLVQLAIPGDAATRTTGYNRFAIRAYGLDTASPLSANDNNLTAAGEVFLGVASPLPNADIDGDQSLIVMSKVVAVTNANPDPNGTAIPTGPSTIARYAFSGAANVNTQNQLNDFVLHDIMFTLNAENVILDASAFAFFNAADTNTTTPCSAFNQQGVAQTGTASGTLYVHCQNIAQSAVNSAVDSGTVQNFALRATVVNSQVNAASAAALQVTLDRLNEPSAEVFGITGSHVRWVDTDATIALEVLWMDVASPVLSTYYSTAGAVCGDGAIEGNEACDDSDTDSGDGCSATCSIENGFVCTGEPSVCHAVVCGDGTREGAETCDDGDTDSGDGCSATCSVEAGYSCNNNTPNVCDLCGNGVRGGMENCDDGNTVSGDGCSATCGSEMGFSCNTGVSPNQCMPNCVDLDGVDISNASEVITFAVVHNYDKCDTNPLVEYLIHEKACITEGVTTFTERCPVGTTCQENGQGVAACVAGGPAPSGNELNCSDTDSGFDIFTAGTATDTAANMTDSDACFGTTHVDEVYCQRETGQIRSLLAKCPAGQSCLNGACVAN